MYLEIFEIPSLSSTMFLLQFIVSFILQDTYFEIFKISSFSLEFYIQHFLLLQFIQFFYYFILSMFFLTLHHRLSSNEELFI